MIVVNSVTTGRLRTTIIC